MAAATIKAAAPSAPRRAEERQAGPPPVPLPVPVLPELDVCPLVPPLLPVGAPAPPLDGPLLLVVAVAPPAPLAAFPPPQLEATARRQRDPAATTVRGLMSPG